MAESYSITAILKAKVDGLVSGFKQAEDTVNSFVKKNEKTFESFKQVGAAATAGGVAIAGGLGYAVKIAADFEAQMSVVGAISGATGDELILLSGKAREMGANTKYSASESAKAFEDLARMGWTTAEMLGGVEGVMALASAGGIELSDAANITASSLAMFGMKADESARVADVLAAAASGTGTDVLALGESFKMVGPSANAAGMEIEETAAFLGLLADNSILGSSAGTTMNAMLRDMKKNSEDGAIAIGDTAVAIYDAEGNMRGFSDIIADVEGATEGMTTAQKDAALMSVFGDEAMRGLNVALGSGSEELKRIEAEMRGAEGTAKDMSDAMEDNLNGAMTSLSSALEGAAISIGSVFIPVIRELAEFVKSLVDKFNGLDDKTKTIIAVIAALAAGFLLLIGPIFLLIGFIPSMLAGFTALSTVIGVLTGPIALTVAAIIAIGAALVIAYNKFEWFRDVVDSVWQAIVSVIMAAVDGVVAFVQDIVTQISTYWNENGELIRSATENVWKAIQTVISTVMPIIQGIIQAVWFVIQTIVMSVWENIKGVIQGALDVILGLVKVFAGLFTGDWQAMWDGVKQLFSGAVTLLWNLVQLMLWGKLLKGIAVFAGAFRGAAFTMWGAVRGVFTSAITAIRNFFTSGFNAMRNVANTSMNGIRTVVSTVWNTIKTVFTTVINTIKTTVTTGFSNVVTAIRTKMTEAVTAVRTKVTEMAGKITGGVKDFIQGGKDLIQGLIDGIMNMGAAAIGAITGVVDGVVNKAKSLLGIKSPSRVFMAIGSDTGAGLVKGIKGTEKDAENASASLTESLIEELVEMQKNAKEQVKVFGDVILAELEIVKSNWLVLIDKMMDESRERLKAMYGIGRFAGQGLLDGLTSMEPALLAKARAIANAIKATIQSALDINSPSRWMRDMIGKNMMIGWIDGMEAMKEKVVAMAANATSWMKPDVPVLSGIDVPSFPHPQYQGKTSGTNSSQSNGNTGGDLIQHITINSPNPTSPSENARKIKQQSRDLLNEWRG